MGDGNVDSFPGGVRGDASSAQQFTKEEREEDQSE